LIFYFLDKIYASAHIPGNLAVRSLPLLKFSYYYVLRSEDL